MAVAVRESWTDERLDDFKERVDQRFQDVDRRFDRIEAKMDAGFARMDARFDSLQHTLIYALVALMTTVLAGVIGLVATQL